MPPPHGVPLPAARRLLESDLIDGSRPLLQYVGVGLIEELVKILAAPPPGGAGCG